MAPMGEDGNLQPYSNMLQRRPEYKFSVDVGDRWTDGKHHP